MAGLYNGRTSMAPNDIAIADEGTVSFTASRYLGHGATLVKDLEASCAWAAELRFVLLTQFCR